MSNPVIPQQLAIEQLRSGGYKDAAHALAELIDNSIQAGASKVEILCAEQHSGPGMRIQEIGVLDNGGGMDAQVLQIALQLGNGTRLRATSGMGKFGMGLPMASISQVKRVEVYSWQKGETPLHTWIDVEDIASGEMVSVPTPEEKEIPKVWREAGESFEESGTLVVWKKPDRLRWVRGKTIARHSNFIVGRMYRYLLDQDHQNPVSISFKTFSIGQPRNAFSEEVIPNDPLMLKPYAGLSGFWKDNAICDPYGNGLAITVHTAKGEVPVRVRYSIAKEKARHDPDGTALGSKPHGKHAQKHMGVSIVRAGRELEVLTDFVQDSYLDRWWGAEISFDPDLDEVFGVTNNKQSATNLAEVARAVLKADLSEMAEMKDVAREDGELGRVFLIDLVRKVAADTRAMHRHIKAQGSSAGSKVKKNKRFLEAQKKATLVGEKRNKSGKGTVSKELGKDLTEAQKREALRAELEKGGHTKATTEQILDSYFKEGLDVEFVAEALDSPVIFSPVPKAGKVLVKVNTAHPSFHHLVEVLEADTGDEAQPEGVEDVRDRLHKAAVGLRLLFASWSRMEDELVDRDERDQVAQLRQIWGTYARDYLK